jgi:HAD superfamily hydrolase (TIGR01509 family)
MNVQAVIYDLDGVIAETESLHLESWRGLLAQHGCEVSEAYYHKFIGIGDVTSIPIFNRELGLSLDVQDAVDEKLRLYLELIEQRGLTPLPGIVESWKSVREASLKMAVATSAPYHIAMPVLRAAMDGAGIRQKPHDFFDAILTRDDVTDMKPAPEVYLKAAEALNVDPTACVAIEDSVPGVQSALAAGMLCVAVPTRYTPVESVAAADIVAASVDELLQRGFPLLQRPQKAT